MKQNSDFQNIAIIGDTGAIGSAIIKRCQVLFPEAYICGFSSQNSRALSIEHFQIDYADEKSIEQAVQKAAQDKKFDLVFVATGILHDEDGLAPEKSLRDLSFDKFEKIFAANTIFPALAAKHFIPHLNKDGRSVFAALSARVGSISDNYLGGWYAYRASKAALNMIIRNAAIEVGRRHKEAIIVGLHPGTVDSDLSKPFQSNVKEGKLFSPDYSAEQLLSVIDNLKAKDSGKCFAWDGHEIQP